MEMYQKACGDIVDLTGGSDPTGKDKSTGGDALACAILGNCPAPMKSGGVSQCSSGIINGICRDTYCKAQPGDVRCASNYCTLHSTEAACGASWLWIARSIRACQAARSRVRATNPAKYRRSAKPIRLSLPARLPCMCRPRPRVLVTRRRSILRPAAS